MKITSWNVNGIRARFGQLCDWIAQHRPDVVCLQELKAAPAEVPGTLELNDYWWYWHGQKGYSGVGLGVRKSLSPTVPAFFHPPFDRESRIVLARLDTMIVGSVYVPNGGKDLAAKMDFLQALDAFAQEGQERGQSLVLCGDFNVAMTDQDVHPKERKPQAIGQLPDERSLLRRIASRGLVDLGRSLDPDNDNLFTWWAPWRELRQLNVGWRIDYVFASAQLAVRATSCPSYREFGTSDHAPLLATFAVT